MKIILLIGYSGCGKTYIQELLNKELNVSIPLTKFVEREVREGEVNVKKITTESLSSLNREDLDFLCLTIFNKKIYFSVVNKSANSVCVDSSIEATASTIISNQMSLNTENEFLVILFSKKEGDIKAIDRDKTRNPASENEKNVKSFEVLKRTLSEEIFKTRFLEVEIKDRFPDSNVVLEAVKNFLKD